MGYYKVKDHMKKDWLQELKKLKNKNWKKIYHVVILHTYKESDKIIRESLNSLLRSDYHKEKLIVLLAVEERAGQEYQLIAKQIEKEYKNTFFAFLTVVHPGDIPGEIAGKGSNVAFAAHSAKKFIDDKGIKHDDV